MKSIVSIAFLFAGISCFGQSVAEANVYPSNLEENMYYEKYDASSNTISGITFMVLCDGDNSTYVTPAFDVSLYLIPEGSTDGADVKIVKTYPLEGIYHMGSHEFKNETVKLSGISGLTNGNYRLGVWVNSGNSFSEDGNDNAMLFKGTIHFAAKAGVQPTDESPSGSDDDFWSDDDDSDDGW